MGAMYEEEITTLPSRRLLRRCCCGCTLQIGCVIIGTLGVLNGIGVMGSGLLSLVVVSSFGAVNLINIITVMYGALHLLAGLCLIYGADKRRISLLTFWLYTQYFELAVSIPFGLYYFVLLFLLPAQVSMVLLLIFAFVVAIGILLYFIAVVHSFRNEVSDDIKALKENIESASSNTKSNW